MAGRWATTAMRWLDNGFSLRSTTTTTTSSFLRWPQHLTISPRWGPQRWWGLSDFSFNIVDDVVWGVITAFESVALVSMLAFFFLFCGCTV